ncbi:MAG TPA: ATP-binding cassette domain-containing protein [Virgibacillus sp.]|nr:ATP-binding cassette domain-containing protein [Virgibacillus sp.]
MFTIEQLVVQDIMEIDDLSLKANVISIEGQSGSGKSTLLRLLNNLDDPSSGVIRFHHQALVDIPPLELRKRVVMLPQSSVIFDGTIRDNLLVGLKLSNQPLASDVVLEEMLHTLWIEKNLDTSASDLSGGEQQRMSLGRLLLMEESEVFLLDEPSSDLDDQTTNHVLDQFMKQTKNAGQQVIMVTHDKEVSNKFADEVINMDTYSKQIHHGGEANGR